MRKNRLFWALFLGVVIAVAFDSMWGLAAVALPLLPRFMIVFARWVGVRFILSRLIILLLLVASAFGLKRFWLEKYFNHACRVWGTYCGRCTRWWRELGYWIKAVLILLPLVLGLGALLAGFSLGALALLAVRFPLVTSTIATAGKSGIGWLAKRAGGEVLDKHFVKAWRKLPNKQRHYVERNYRKLWYWTMFRIARSKRARRKAKAHVP